MAARQKKAASQGKWELPLDDPLAADTIEYYASACARNERLIDSSIARELAGKVRQAQTAATEAAGEVGPIDEPETQQTASDTTED